MATKAEGCAVAQDIDATEFDRIERAAKARSGGSKPLNKHYIEVVEGLLNAAKAQLSALQTTAPVRPPAQPVVTAGEGAGVPRPTQGVAPVARPQEPTQTSAPRSKGTSPSAKTIPGAYSGPATRVDDTDAFLADNEGVRAGVERLQAVGLGYAFEQVDAIYIAEDSAGFDADGSIYFDPDTNELQLWFSRATLDRPSLAKFTLIHEMGHVVDGAFGSAQGLDKFSSDARLGVSNLLMPTGSVARALDAEVAADTNIGEIMRYPLETVQSQRNTSEEIFAQLLALALVNNDVAAQLPPVAQQFISEVIRDAKQNGEGYVRQARLKAARETRAGGSKTRYGKTAPERGAAAQGAVSGRGGSPATGRVTPAGALAPTVHQDPPYMSQAPSQAREMAKGALLAVRDWTFTRGAFTRDLLSRAATMLPAANTYYQKMQAARVESTRLSLEVGSILEATNGLSVAEKGTGPRSVNALIRTMTYENKWAFKPDWVPTAKVDPVLAAWFNNELSSKAQDVVTRVFKHGNESLKAAQQAAKDSIESEVNPLIEKARAAGDTKTVDELEKAKVEADGKFRRLVELRGQTPYAPLRRFGNWAVVAKSKRYQDAEARNDTKELDELSRDGKHYHVEFVSNRMVARAREETLRQRMGDVAVSHFERTDDALLYGGESMFKAFSRFRNLAREKMDEGDTKVVETLDKALASMYISLVAETSARTAEFARRSVAGADMDMMQSFAEQGRAMAYFTGSLRTSGDAMDALRDMKQQVKNPVGGDRATASTLYNEVLRRHAMGLDYEPNAILDKALAVNSYWSLITSPSYLLMNLTQPWIATLPVLAGRFGAGRAASEMTKAYKNIITIATRLVDDPSAVSELPVDVRDVVQELLNRGSIDISLGVELGAFTSGGATRVGVWGEKAIRFPRTLVERGEMVNRVATAVAAYRLARNTPGAMMTHDAAVNYADKVIYETHGDYSAFNSPRLMRNAVGRFATQFRKFQLIQITMYARLISDASAKMSTPERLAARKALAYSLSTLMVLGGITALPGFTAISFLLGAFGDDDEPDNPEATLRRFFGGGPEADLLVRGVPNLAGLNIGSRIGAAGMLSILPYTDLEASRAGYQDILLGLAGPFVGGTLPKALDGWGMIAQGDYWKGLEMTLPRGFADVLRGVRFSTEGVSKRNGDVVLNAEEVNFFEGFMQAAGLPTKVVTDNQLLRNSQFNADAFYKSRTGSLKREYVEAYRAGDGRALARVRDEWKATQEARKRLGYPVQPLSELRKAPQAQRKREAKPMNTTLLE